MEATDSHINAQLNLNQKHSQDRNGVTLKSAKEMHKILAKEAALNLKVFFLTSHT